MPSTAVRGRAGRPTAPHKGGPPGSTPGPTTNGRRGRGLRLPEAAAHAAGATPGAKHVGYFQEESGSNPAIRPSGQRVARREGAAHRRLPDLGEPHQLNKHLPGAQTDGYFIWLKSALCRLAGAGWIGFESQRRLST